MSEKPERPDSAGVWFPPPLIFVLAFAAGELLHAYFPRLISDWQFLSLKGQLILWAGTLLMIVSALHFLRARTSILPAAPSSFLVVKGAYRVSRNPMYLSLTIIYAGISLMLNHLWPLLFLVLPVLIIDRYVIQREERYLERRFGAEYLAFKGRVRRWV